MPYYSVDLRPQPPPCPWLWEQREEIKGATLTRHSFPTPFPIPYQAAVGVEQHLGLSI